jgi:hypothetical protein
LVSRRGGRQFARQGSGYPHSIWISSFADDGSRLATGDAVGTVKGGKSDDQWTGTAIRAGIDHGTGFVCSRMFSANQGGEYLTANAIHKRRYGEQPDSIQNRPKLRRALRVPIADKVSLTKSARGRVVTKRVVNGEGRR